MSEIGEEVICAFCIHFTVFANFTGCGRGENKCPEGFNISAMTAMEKARAIIKDEGFNPKGEWVGCGCGGRK